jgi:hypothetical protein
MNLISKAIEEFGLLGDIEGVPGMDCSGSKFHSPTPLASVRVDLADIFAAPTDDQADPIWLCQNCLTNLRIFVLLMIASTGTLTWECRRQFGNLIRELGVRAWESYYKEQVRDGAG